MAISDEFPGINDDHFAAGDRLAQRYISFLTDEIEPPNRPLPLALDDNVYLRDIYQYMNTFKRLLNILKKVNNGVPCISINKETVIPINLFHYLDNLEKFEELAPGLDYLRYSKIYSVIKPLSYTDIFRRLIRDLGKWGNVRLLERKDVLNYTFENLRSFIAFRFGGNTNSRTSEGTFEYPNDINNGTNYFSIKLKTRNHGLQIESSPAYFLSWSYFGYPTSPLLGPLQPGWYVFGGKGASLPNFTFDPTIVKIPPHVDINLYNI